MAKATACIAFAAPPSLLVGMALVAAITAFSCGPGPTARDKEQLAAAASKWAGSCELRPKREIYLDVRYLGEGCPEEGSAESLYRDFWLLEDEPRKDTMFVYLNVFSKQERFCFQLVWDPGARSLTRGSTPYS